MLNCAASTTRCSQRTPSGVRTNVANAAGAAPTGAGLHQSCKVLRATPRSAATCRCGCPAATRAAATSICSARSRRERRLTTDLRPTAVQRAVAATPHLG